MRPRTCLTALALKPGSWATRQVPAREVQADQVDQVDQVDQAVLVAVVGAAQAAVVSYF
jgi:hypothetical protein